jgi:ATP-binding cassette subfamily C protein LapB
MTIIVVTHRPSTLGIADRVFAIRGGRLEPVS